MTQYLLAIDAGTSSNRAVVYDERATTIASAQKEFPQEYPKPGWVEHDPEAIWSTVVDVTREALAQSGISPGDVAGIGITNQRETTLIWDRETGQCVHHAIVWQDRRTANYCAGLKERGLEPMVSQKTGLRLDPYFSGTKIAWILDNVVGVREKAEQGKLAFGTVDCFLLWRLTGGASHATDATNASRTLLYNIHTQDWDDELLKMFDIPRELLPDVRDCASEFGTTTIDAIGAKIPVRGLVGDQHAALIGQAGFGDGVTKSTYGTGCFVMANTGTTVVRSDHKLLTTVAYRFDGQTNYAIEGSIFVAGSAIQWLRDELKVIDDAAATEQIAERNGVVENVHLVPAFAGLGAPYWDPDARAAILGMSRDTNIDQIVTATLQAIAYQTVDLIKAASEDGLKPSAIRVDGGMVGNNWFLQFLADMLGLPVERPKNVESTAVGAAFVAGLQSGVYSSTDEIAALWESDRLFESSFAADRRDSLYRGWQEAVARVRSGD
jgi:glycerol kinase